ncbi:MAG: hypothetical protein RXR02_06955 [Thermoproteus sp.]
MKTSLTFVPAGPVYLAQPAKEHVAVVVVEVSGGLRPALSVSSAVSPSATAPDRSYLRPAASTPSSALPTCPITAL